MLNSFNGARREVKCGIGVPGKKRAIGGSVPGKKGGIAGEA